MNRIKMMKNILIAGNVILLGGMAAFIVLWIMQGQQIMELKNEIKELE